jgi:hypothetical protein
MRGPLAAVTLLSLFACTERQMLHASLEDDPSLVIRLVIVANGGRPTVRVLTSTDSVAFTVAGARSEVWDLGYRREDLVLLYPGLASLSDHQLLRSVSAQLIDAEADDDVLGPPARIKRAVVEADSGLEIPVEASTPEALSDWLRSRKLGLKTQLSDEVVCAPVHLEKLFFPGDLRVFSLSAATEQRIYLVARSTSSTTTDIVRWDLPDRATKLRSFEDIPVFVHFDPEHRRVYYSAEPSGAPFLLGVMDEDGRELPLPPGPTGELESWDVADDGTLFVSAGQRMFRLLDGQWQEDSPHFGGKVEGLAAVAHDRALRHLSPEMQIFDGTHWSGTPLLPQLDQPNWMAADADQLLVLTRPGERVKRLLRGDSDWRQLELPPGKYRTVVAGGQRRVLASGAVGELVVRFRKHVCTVDTGAPWGLLRASAVPRTSSAFWVGFAPVENDPQVLLRLDYDGAGD